MDLIITVTEHVVDIRATSDAGRRFMQRDPRCRRASGVGDWEYMAPVIASASRCRLALEFVAENTRPEESIPLEDFVF